MYDIKVILSQYKGVAPYDNQPEIDDLVGKVILQGLHVNDVTELKNQLPQNPRILIKPNWVFHRPFRNGSMDCLITNKAIIKSVLRFIDAIHPQSVIIGDSPIQECDFDSIVTKGLRDELQKQINVPIIFLDFRRYILARKEDLSSGLVENQEISKYVKFDLKENSLLEPIVSKVNKFQITNYDVRELEKHHQNGKHEYLICEEVFDSDLIINLPKLKMHRLAGYTGAIKNFVGCIGDKAYLPHHRLGGTLIGGDCYPGLHLFKFFAELCINHRNQVVPDLKKVKRWNNYQKVLLKIDNMVSRVIRPLYKQVLFGSWHGNDTVWRTVLDIYKIIEYGDATGIIQKEKQREIWSITDALICGEGNGPLNPTPRHLGLLTFSTSEIAADIFHGLLIGYLPNEVKFLEHLLQMMNPDDIMISFENNQYGLQEILERFRVNLMKPDGWK